MRTDYAMIIRWHRYGDGMVTFFGNLQLARYWRGLNAFHKTFQTTRRRLNRQAQELEDAIARSSGR